MTEQREWSQEKLNEIFRAAGAQGFYGWLRIWSMLINLLSVDKLNV